MLGGRQQRCRPASLARLTGPAASSSGGPTALMQCALHTHPQLLQQWPATRMATTEPVRRTEALIPLMPLLKLLSASSFITCCWL